MAGLIWGNGMIGEKLGNIVLLFVALACSSIIWAQEGKTPSTEELKATSARGRMLEEYDVAAWHATDAVEALKPDHAAAPLYLAHKVGSKWEVVFGRMSPQQDKFLIVYRATEGTKETEFTAKKMDPPLGERGFYFEAAKAMDTATKDFGNPGRPYNGYVLPSEDGQLYVYFLPGQTREGVFPLGGDVRYTVSLDGGTIVTKRQMHKTIVEAKSAPKDGQVAAGAHKHTDDDEIEDSDVFHVLNRTPLVPEYVGTPDQHLYEIKTDGSITRLR
jgi:hypothetical protein